MAPFIGEVQAAAVWKFSLENRELYVIGGRTPGSKLTHISFHESGMAHMHLGADQRQPLQPPLTLGASGWQHLLEMRFLLSEDAFRPRRDSFTGRAAYYTLRCDVAEPTKYALCLNLLQGAQSSEVAPPLPGIFDGARMLWLRNRRDGRPVALIARKVPMAGENQEQLNYVRKVLQPRANFSQKPFGPLYVETRISKPRHTGNFIFVIPMGAEAVNVVENA